MTATTERDWEKLKLTFCQFPRQQQIGHIATNMARIMGALHEQKRESMARMSIRENLNFIEWIALNQSDGTVAELITLSNLLNSWESSWAEVWNDSSTRQDSANQAQYWSNRLLDRSGLAG
jgi:hypothetical protein